MSAEEIIHKRRSIDPNLFTGEIVSDTIVERMLIAANCAPTHGVTEPWRFIVLTKDAIQAFSQQHAELYKSLTSEEQFAQNKYDKILNRANKCSHLIICAAKCGTKSNIPDHEEIAATCCAIENMLLIASENQVATFWSTGGMFYHPKMKEILGFDEQDKMVALLFIGKCAENAPIKARHSDWKTKVQWK
ncbi:MAG: nitroreductase [Chitinophagales bacterium]